MNHFKKSLLIGLAMLSFGAAQAQTAEGRHSHTARMEKMQADHSQRFTERMNKLHDALKLTSAQEPAWTTYVAAVTPAADAHPAADRAANAALSAPERADKHLAMAKAHMATMEAHVAAMKTFYGTLTADQKKTFDTAMASAHGARRAMMMHAMKKQ